MWSRLRREATRLCRGSRGSLTNAGVHGRDAGRLLNGQPLGGSLAFGVSFVVRTQAGGGGLRTRGFTLIEMMVVVSLIAIIVSITLPQLMPAILFSKLEGSARHLAAYGRAAMAQSVLMRETVTVKFDLGDQVYWAEHVVEKDGGLFEDGEEKKKDKKAEDSEKKDILDLMGSEDEIDDVELEEAINDMRDQFDAFVRTQLEDRVQDLDKDGLLSDIDPLADVRDFSLDEDDTEIEEIKDPLLERTKLPQGIEIVLIQIGGERNASGEVEIELSASGLGEPVTFHLKNEDDDYFTIEWDAIRGDARVESGKQTPETGDTS